MLAKEVQQRGHVIVQRREPCVSKGSGQQSRRRGAATLYKFPSPRICYPNKVDNHDEGNRRHGRGRFGERDVQMLYTDPTHIVP